jgi:hypothetical protein
VKVLGCLKMNMQNEFEQIISQLAADSDGPAKSSVYAAANGTKKPQKCATKRKRTGPSDIDHPEAKEICLGDNSRSSSLSNGSSSSSNNSKESLVCNCNNLNICLLEIIQYIISFLRK